MEQPTNLSDSTTSLAGTALNILSVAFQFLKMHIVYQ